MTFTTVLALVVRLSVAPSFVEESFAKQAAAAASQLGAAAAQSTRFTFKNWKNGSNSEWLTTEPSHSLSGPGTVSRFRVDPCLNESDPETAFWDIVRRWTGTNLNMSVDHCFMHDNVLYRFQNRQPLKTESPNRRHQKLLWQPSRTRPRDNLSMPIGVACGTNQPCFLRLESACRVLRRSQVAWSGCGL
jgi:hypothetical protein